MRYVKNLNRKPNTEKNCQILFQKILFYKKIKIHFTYTFYDCFSLRVSLNIVEKKKTLKKIPPARPASAADDRDNRLAWLAAIVQSVASH